MLGNAETRPKRESHLYKIIIFLWLSPYQWLRSEVATIPIIVYDGGDGIQQTLVGSHFSFTCSYTHVSPVRKQQPRNIVYFIIEYGL